MSAPEKPPVVSRPTCRAKSRRGLASWSEGHRCCRKLGHQGKHLCRLPKDGTREAVCLFTWGRFSR